MSQQSQFALAEPIRTLHAEWEPSAITASQKPSSSSPIAGCEASASSRLLPHFLQKLALGLRTQPPTQLLLPAAAATGRPSPGAADAPPVTPPAWLDSSNSSQETMPSSRPPAGERDRAPARRFLAAAPRRIGAGVTTPSLWPADSGEFADSSGLRGVSSFLRAVTTSVSLQMVTDAIDADAEPGSRSQLHLSPRQKSRVRMRCLVVNLEGPPLLTWLGGTSIHSVSFFVGGSPTRRFFLTGTSWVVLTGVVC